MWNKLHFEKLNNLYSSPSIVRGIISRRMRWADYVARIGRRAVYTGLYVCIYVCMCMYVCMYAYNKRS